MANTKRTRVNFTSPKGVFKFPKLNEPDTKFKKEGEYSVKLILKLADPATKAILDKLAPLYAAALANGQAEFKAMKIAARKALEAKGGFSENPLYTTVYDEKTEEPTGEIELKFTKKASGETQAGKKWTSRVDIFDAKGVKLKNAPSIWGGTVGKVAFSVLEGGYFVPATGVAGLSLSLEGVQIIELKSGSGKSAQELGFGEEEGFDGSSNELNSEEGSEGNYEAGDPGSQDDGQGDF